MSSLEEPLLGTAPASPAHASDDHGQDRGNARVAEEEEVVVVAAPPSMWSASAVQYLCAFVGLTLVDGSLAVACAHQRASFDWHQGMDDALVLFGARSLVHAIVIMSSVVYCAPRARLRAMNSANAEVAMPVESKLPRLGSNKADPKRDWERAAHAEAKKQIFLQGFTLAMAFLADTLTALFSAVKSVSFEYGDDYLLLGVLCSTVVLVNLEFYLVNSLVWTLAEERGRLVPSLHNHELFYAPKMPGHWCDGCHSRIVGEAYRCKLCDFDACPSCFDKAWRQSNNPAIAAKHKEVMGNRQYFFRALSYGRKHWFLLGCSSAALLLSSAANLALPSLTGRILDSVYAKDKHAFETNVVRMVIASCCISALSVVQYACISVVGRRIAAQVRLHLFSALLAQDIGFFDGQMSGQLTSRLTNDVSGMVSPWSSILNTCLSSGLTLIGGLVMCILTSVKLSCLAVASIGPIIFLTRLYARFSRSMNKEIYAALADANSVATEAFANVRTVRAFSTEKREVERYNRAVRVALSKGTKDSLASAGTSAATSVVDMATSTLILGFGGWTAIQHPDELSAGDLLKFQLYWAMIDGSWRSLNSVVNSLMVSAAAAQRVLSLMDNLPDIDLDKGDVFNTKLGPPALEFENVTFRYPARPENVVMRNVSLSIEAGKVTAFAGPSGSGKSTVVALITRMYDPTEGRVLLNGADLKSWNLTSFHSCIGLVQQDTQLFATSVLENIAYGLDEDQYTAEDVIKAARSAMIHEEIMGFEDGYSTKIGERGVRLSGGQRQRIALARVFLRKPKLLLLDEATSALDSENEAHVQAAIDQLFNDDIGKSATCVVVAHRLSTIAKADKIIVVQAGQVAEVGSHATLMERPDGVYAKLVKTQLLHLNEKKKGAQ